MEELAKEVGYFNPLSLYRERRIDDWGGMVRGIFQSTLPIQGETDD